jgi:hypothetical protein
MSRSAGIVAWEILGNIDTVKILAGFVMVIPVAGDQPQGKNIVGVI